MEIMDNDMVTWNIKRKNRSENQIKKESRPPIVVPKDDTNVKYILRTDESMSWEKE
jgi:hypothetical protein